LVENLWSYQWCKQIAELTDEIFDTLYEHTQGVTDFLVKLLVLSQRYAVQSGSECLTAEILDEGKQLKNADSKASPFSSA